MKIYFAGSINGGRQDAPLYLEIIRFLQEMGYEVPTEHIGNAAITDKGEEAFRKITGKEIYDRDCAWIRESGAVVAEVTQPSHGVGYELGYAESLGKPVLCLYRPAAREGKQLSAMISGNPRFKIIEYQQIEELKEKLKSVL